MNDRDRISEVEHFLLRLALLILLTLALMKVLVPEIIAIAKVFSG